MWAAVMKGGLDIMKYLSKCRDEILPVWKTYDQKIVKDDMTQNKAANYMPTDTEGRQNYISTHF